MDEDYYTVPKIFWNDGLYNQLTLEDMLIYAVLKDKVLQAVNRGWIDSEGGVYLNYTLKEFAKMFGVSKVKMIQVMQRLEECNLIERELTYELRLRQYRTYVNEL